MLLFLLYLKFVDAMVSVLPHDGSVIHALYALAIYVQAAYTLMSQPQQYGVTPPDFLNTFQPSPSHAQPSP